MKRILLIGCGGIGSWLCHFLAFGRRNSLFQAEIAPADPDKAEEKNLLYSNFGPEDAGKNKAISLASRYNFKAIPKEIRSKMELKPFNLILIATDDAKSRKMVYESGKDWVDMRCGGGPMGGFCQQRRGDCKGFQAQGQGFEHKEPVLPDRRRYPGRKNTVRMPLMTLISL